MQRKVKILKYNVVNETFNMVCHHKQFQFLLRIYTWNIFFISDATSRFQEEIFRQLAPGTEKDPIPCIPYQETIYR